MEVITAQLDDANKEGNELRSQCLSWQCKMEEEECQAQKFSFSKIQCEPKVFKFYTGIEVDNFHDILRILGSSVDTMSYFQRGMEHPDHHGRDPAVGMKRTLSKEDELLLTLCKLRHDFPESDLAARFMISQASVSRIFRAWVLCLSHTFRDCDIWPSQEYVRACLPAVFQEKWHSTRIIIDATEFPIAKPSNPDMQSATWSSYKNRNTLKVLVGCTPNGVLSFVSDVYGGRVADKELTKRSGILQKLDFGDSIMADRGFDIEDILPDGIHSNVPPFLGGRKQLEQDEVLQTRIATLWIHVEKCIERIKNYRITHFFPAMLCPLAAHIIFICCFLTLYEEPLVPCATWPFSLPQRAKGHAC